jgi:hypothetical protein
MHVPVRLRRRHDRVCPGHPGRMQAHSATSSSRRKSFGLAGTGAAWMAGTSLAMTESSDGAMRAVSRATRGTAARLPPKLGCVDLSFVKTGDMLLFILVFPPIPLAWAGAVGLIEPTWRRKIWKPILLVWIYCNPLKSHKTTKTFFGNPWRKQADFWKCLEKAWNEQDATERRRPSYAKQLNC